MLLTTTGRRTGKPRTVPLLYLSDGDRLVICNVNPGFERPDPWVLNLQAEPRAQVQIGRRTTTATARLASAGELAAYWPQLATIWPAYQSFHDKGGERSVFVLRTGHSALTSPTSDASRQPAARRVQVCSGRPDRSRWQPRCRGRSPKQRCAPVESGLWRLQTAR